MHLFVCGKKIKILGSLPFCKPCVPFLSIHRRPNITPVLIKPARFKSPILTSSEKEKVVICLISSVWAYDYCTVTWVKLYWRYKKNLEKNWSFMSHLHVNTSNVLDCSRNLCKFMSWKSAWKGWNISRVLLRAKVAEQKLKLQTF